MDDIPDDEDFLDFAAKYDAPTGNPSSRQLFMGSISPEATEEYIRDSAADFGELESVRISVFFPFSFIFHHLINWSQCATPTAPCAAVPT
jgi:hypothetical protein